MKIYNQDKTAELAESEIDYEKGQLVADKLLIVHHEAKPFIKGKSVEALVAEKQAAGVKVIEINGKQYAVDKEYDNSGRSVSEIKAELDTEAVEAYDEYEDIQVYVPYTDDELKERKYNRLREQRKPLLEAFDKWEKAVLRGREDDDDMVMEWYIALLDLQDSAFESIPERVRYYQ